MSGSFGTYEMAFYLTGEQRADLVTFVVTTLSGGSSTISGFPDPVDGSTATFLIVSGPEYDFSKGGDAAAQRDGNVRMTWRRVT